MESSSGGTSTRATCYYIEETASGSLNSYLNSCIRRKCPSRREGRRMKLRPLLPPLLSLLSTAAGSRSPPKCLEPGAIHEPASKCERSPYCNATETIFSCQASIPSTMPQEVDYVCFGPCPAGFFCPGATSSPVACGNSTVFCPVGSSQPISVSPGKYSVGGLSPAHRVAEASCPPGTYCQGGVAVACPRGTYGERAGLREDVCSGACPPGWYCPVGTVDAFSWPCGGPAYYCPSGSGAPLLVDRGHFAEALAVHRYGKTGGYGSQRRCPVGRYCQGGQSFACPPGRFGAEELATNSSCSGSCREGHYCPAGSYRSDQNVCGNSSVYCPAGSAAPILSSEGFYTVKGDVGDFDRHPWRGVAESQSAQMRCEPGFYCTGGERRACPAGFFGNVSGLSSSSCTGLCAAGYTCGEGATTPAENVCGGEGHLFCPEGSSVPTLVTKGYYTISESADTSGGADADDSYAKITRTAEARCDPGCWCSAGIRHLCPAGTFGDIFGMEDPECSGLCDPGYVCASGSVTAKGLPCGNATVFCSGGNGAPEIVSEGYYSVGGKGATTRTGEALAPVGSYADEGMLFVCPAGRFGASPGLSSPRCSGACKQGFYCPAGSVTSMERACGDASLYCPTGSSGPITVERGHYTTDYMTLPDQEPCPPGHFRNKSFPHNTDPTRGKSSAIATAIPVPPCEICPEGTFKANTGDDRELCVACDERTPESTAARTSCTCRRISEGDLTAAFLYFNTSSAACENVTANFQPPAEGIVVQSVFTRYSQKECEPGHFCVEGIRFPCPPGRFGSQARENRPECQGACAAGWYCPAASVSATQIPCGAANLYCPEGSTSPEIAEVGFYTIGDYGIAEGFSRHEVVSAHRNMDADDRNAVARPPDDSIGSAFRRDVELCPKGWYCAGDGLGAKCPPGVYGSQTGLSDRACSGPCAAGHFCPPGSVSPHQNKCGSLGVYCPVGSSEPLEVLQGFYGVYTGPSADYLAASDPSNETHSAQVLCEPGYFCVGGSKDPCPPGTFSWQYGASSQSTCLPCKAGYFCSEPASPSTVATPAACGDSSLFCPEGSAQPTSVEAGFYSLGGASDGTSRTSQILCEPGSYCSDGRKRPCPRGTFGASAGLHDRACSGMCPPGAACPEGTVDPVPCEEGFYAVGGAVSCSACPGQRGTGAAERCGHSRHCCT